MPTHFLKEILGYAEEELLGKELWEIGVFKDIIDSKKAFLELQIQGYIRYRDLPLQTKNGRRIEVEFISNVYMVGDQKVIQCNIRDITDRRQTEEMVLARTQELEDLTKSQELTKVAMLNVMEDLETAKSLLELAKAKDEAMLASIGEGLIAVDNHRRVMIINKFS
jgi:PAS domain S-box-containing protein